MKTKPLFCAMAGTALVATAGVFGVMGVTQGATATSTIGKITADTPLVTSDRDVSSLSSKDSDEEVHPHQPRGPDGDTFYSPSDTAKLWTRYIKSVTAPLPDGVRFPGKLKQFETPANGEKQWLQDGAVPQLAGHYWQCAWEDVAVTALKTGDKNGYLQASHTASTWLTALPGLEKFVDNWTAIEEQGRAAAVERGITFEEYDLSVNCRLYPNERPGKDQ